MTWQGDYYFVLRNLIAKDFRVRYRKMSLGIFWSLLNPLVMMGVLTFVFTKIFPNQETVDYPLFILCGLIPFNFFSLAWSTGTNCIVENTALIKRTTFPKEAIPIASVLSNGLHVMIQMGLLMALVIVFGRGINRNWIWLPYIWGFEVILICGLVLLFGALDVYVRDMRYVVEAFCTISFWLVPIFYSFSAIPPEYRNVYQYNPIAAIVLALRNVLLEGVPPPPTLLLKLSSSSLAILAIGWAVFRRAKPRFYDYL